jgi:kinetochore protein Spc25
LNADVWDFTNSRTEDKRTKKREIEYMTSKSQSHQQTLAKEAAETIEMQAAIASLSAQRDAHQVTKETLKQQIAETQKQIDAKLAAQRAHAKHLDSQSRFNIPELGFWTSTLCMEIEGAGRSDRLKFVFSHIDDRDWKREAYFELDLSKREYEVASCKPKLEQEKIDRVMDQLNEVRDLRVACKGMRELFVEAMKG